MKNNAIGIIELNSIASGIAVTDEMLKTANVELLISRTICSGKYMVLVAGDVASVQASVTSGEVLWRGAVIDTTVIPNLHEDVIPAISGSNDVKETGALGVIESFSVASLIAAADTAAKAANVTLLEIRLAMALGGKAFVTLTGAVAAVDAAVEAGSQEVIKKGMLVNKVVIPRPSPELYKNYI